MRRARRNWPAVGWALIMLGGPAVLHVLGVALPDVVAYPVGIAAPFAGAAFRVLR